MQENVLVSDDGDALIADLGLSTLVDKTANEATTVSVIRLRVTLRFAAPELLDDTLISEGLMRSKTPASDVYAFGMLMLQVEYALSHYAGGALDTAGRLLRGAIPGRGRATYRS